MIKWFIQTPTDADKAMMELDDLKLKDGKVVCSVCGSYCGQCPIGSKYGMTLDEYRDNYRKQTSR